MFRRNRVPEPRRPHPDPRTETRLQRIIALRESAARKSALIGQYTAEIGRLQRRYRNHAGTATTPGGEAGSAAQGSPGRDPAA